MTLLGITTAMLMFIFLGVACRDSRSEKVNTPNGFDENVLLKVQDPNTSGGNKCLLGYGNRFDELLTEADVLAATGFSADVMEVDYSRVIVDPGFHTLSYRFDNKRIQTIAGYTQPYKDHVNLQRIRSISLTQFKNSYRAMTDEEDKVVKNIIDDVTEGNVSSADAKEAKDQLDASGIDKETTKDIMGSLADMFKEVAKGYRNVEGLGDAAVWNLATNELTVLDNGVQFELSVDAKGDPKENQAIAIALAKRILDKCK